MDDDNLIEIIGDVHGCLKTFEKLYESIIKDCKNIYSVGDLVDRGKYSKEVIEFFIAKNIKTVRGNHEDMLLKAIQLPDTEIFKGTVTFLDLYFDNGGAFTQKSYIDSTKKKDFYNFIEDIKKRNHYEYLKSFSLTIEFQKLIISHAGIKRERNTSSYLLNREIPDEIGKLQIFGHTPQSRIKIKPGHYINVDTGCVYGDSLSAVLVNSSTGELIKTYSENADNQDIY